MPEIHPGPSSGLLAARDPLLQQLKDLLIDLGGLKDPLEPAQHRRSCITTLGGNGHRFNRGLPSVQLPFNALPHRLVPPGMVVNDAAFDTKPPRFSGVAHHSCEGFTTRKDQKACA